MTMDRRQARWALTAAGIAVVLLAVYVIYALKSPDGARGGSMIGLFFAALGTGVIVFECLLGLRKRYPAPPLGRVKTWASAHVWLGLLSGLLILMHAGFRWGHGLAALLMTLLAVIVVSGILGIALQNYIPRRMTELVTRETIFEQIPTVVQGLRLEADERVEGGVKQYFDITQRKSAAEKVQAVVEKRKASPQIDVEETARTASRRLLATPEMVSAYFKRLRTIMPVAAHDVLRDLEEICEERRQLIVQRRLHLWLHTWLLAHVPLSFALLVLTAVHAVLSLRY